MQETIKASIRRYIKVFRDAAANNLNEADTVSRLTKFFEDVLGYDPFSEITREQAIKSTYVDIALKTGDEVKMLVEANAAGIGLKEAHTQQAQNYAANKGIPWVLLTNGCQFILYKVHLDGAIQATEVFNINLLENSIADIADRLALIHRKSMVKAVDLEKYYQKQRCLSPDMLIKALASETVINSIAKELKALSGNKVPEDEVFEAVKGLIKAGASVEKLTMRRKPKPEMRKTVEKDQQPI
ncbi:MAG: type I restriction enzyme HsdR N-terminal domain-containing protein [bacterium]|nr:type I restriction enzyme HsdR N-terminal domain-containing protein [bacterium]